MSEHWLYIIISFIIGTLSGGLLNWIRIFQETKKIFKKDHYKLDEKYIGHNANPRFGFSFTEPENWDRVDSDNGDGHRYIFPYDENVFFSVSGQNNGLLFQNLEESMCL